MGKEARAAKIIFCKSFLKSVAAAVLHHSVGGGGGLHQSLSVKLSFNRELSLGRWALSDAVSGMNIDTCWHEPTFNTKLFLQRFRPILNSTLKKLYFEF